MPRYATVLAASAFSIALAVVVGGCGNSRSILYKGISPAGGPRMVISDSAAVRDGKTIRKQWLADIARAGREDPKTRFRNLSASRLRSRLAAAAERYDFTVKRVHVFRPRQFAPLVIVQTHHYLALARVFGSILTKSLDPFSNRRRPKTAFEAFFFEAQDERGVPFIVLSNALRGPHAHGGEWARSEELYPAPHG